MAETLTPLAVAAASFVASHLLLSAAPVRAALVAKLGRFGFTALYSAVAAGTFVWMSQAYTRAPPIDLWPRMGWAYTLALAVMPLATILLACGALTPNPTAVGGARVLARDDPAPGIFRVTRHPVMWAVALWAAVHVLNTADAAALILFGAIGLLAVLGMAHIDARRGRDGGEDWRRMMAVTSLVPFVAALQGRTAISPSAIGWWRIALGIALYIVLAVGHEPVIGPIVTPW